jgi:hypothetical protein
MARVRAPPGQEDLAVEVDSGATLMWLLSHWVGQQRKERVYSVLGM